MVGVQRCEASIHCVKDGRRYIWVNKSKQNKGDRYKTRKHFNTKTEQGDTTKKQRRRGEEGITYGRADPAQYSIDSTEETELRPNTEASSKPLQLAEVIELANNTNDDEENAVGQVAAPHIAGHCHRAHSKVTWDLSVATHQNPSCC